MRAPASPQDPTVAGSSGEQASIAAQAGSPSGRPDARSPGGNSVTTPTFAIAVVGKVPRPGRSKTRLGVTIGADAAAALSAAFLRDTTKNIARAALSAPIRGFVAYAPAGEEALLAPHLADDTALVLADGSGAMPAGMEGLGRCLFAAIRDLLDQGHAGACVLNSDGPTLPTAYLVQAASLLALPGDRAVLGPADDGGYYLLGLKRPHHALFRDIAWSTDGVAAATRERARSIGLEVVELPPWYDVDDAASLRRLAADLAGPDRAGFDAPSTRACLARLGGVVGPAA
jgi:rSAM/selenodomain-associated transferase 1